MKVFLILLPAALALASCSTPDRFATAGGRYHYVSSPGRSGQHIPPVTRANFQDNISYWSGDGVLGEPLIKISLAQQKAYFYKGEIVVGMSPISTGKEGHDTPAGHYRIIEKSPNHRSSIYGVFKDNITHQVVKNDADTTRDEIPSGCYYKGAQMSNFLRFDGGVGMHTGDLPGYSASHGCVRMPDRMARMFFENAPLGTPVIVE